MPGGCCYGNASAIAMIGHSCLINWFFSASWFVRTLKEQVHGKWKINGFLFPSFYYIFLPPSFFCLTTYFAGAISSCFKKCSDGVLNYDWKLEIVMDGGGLSLVIWNAKRMSLFTAGFCEQLLRQTQNLMSCEYYEFSKQARAAHNITLLCIFILPIYWDQLWLECWAFISEPLLVFIKTSYARAL